MNRTENKELFPLPQNVPFRVDFNPTVEIYEYEQKDTNKKTFSIPERKTIKKGDFNFSVQVSPELLQKGATIGESIDWDHLRDVYGQLLGFAEYESMVPIESEIVSGDDRGLLSICIKDGDGDECRLLLNTESSEAHYVSENVDSETKFAVLFSILNRWLDYIGHEGEITFPYELKFQPKRSTRMGGYNFYLKTSSDYVNAGVQVVKKKGEDVVTEKLYQKLQEMGLTKEKTLGYRILVDQWGLSDVNIGEECCCFVRGDQDAIEQIEGFSSHNVDNGRQFVIHFAIFNAWTNMILDEMQNS